mmetsp:Transcript_731/g.1771  ORF Transcript_731/g.1771 Transcript_731/m.1771 type:complete len:642 (-) Transcript_731:144-2069(-)
MSMKKMQNGVEAQEDDTEDEDETEQHGRVFDALKALDKVLAKPAWLQFKVDRLFKKFATPRENGKRALSLEECSAMTKELGAKLNLPDWLFADTEHMFERFDFDGSGALTKTECEKMIRTGLQQRRVELGGLKQPVDVPEHTLESAGYTVVRELGRGGQGVMYLATSDNEKGKSAWMCACDAQPDPENAKSYCIKFYDKEDANACDMDELIAEYALMKEMSNKYVAKTYEVFQDRSFYYLVNEPYFGGDLTKIAKRAHQNHVAMTEDWWRPIFRQVLEGLAYLHQNAIVHCDIKEPNIMIANNDSFKAPVPVLIDFGLSTPFGRLEEDRDATGGVGSPAGTPGYIPPETWETEVWYPVGDVFSLGVVFFQIMVARIPSDHTDIEGVFQEGSNEQEMFKDVKSRPLPWQSFPSDWPDLRSLLEQMTSRDRKTRPRAPQALEHKWFSSTSDASMPATTVRDLVYHSESYDTKDGVVLQLTVMNNLEELRRLNNDCVALKTPTGDVDATAVANLLEEHGLEDSLCEAFMKTCQGKTGNKILIQTLQEAIDSKQKYSEQLVKDLFNDLDADHSGALSQAELRALIDSDAFECPYDDIDEIMEEMDTNQDGKVSYSEFLKVVIDDGRIARRTDVDMKPPKSSCSLM